MRLNYQFSIVAGNLKFFFFELIECFKLKLFSYVSSFKLSSKTIIFSTGSKLHEWWTIWKINKWKGQNKATDNYTNERLDNKHFKVCMQSH